MQGSIVQGSMTLQGASTAQPQSLPPSMQGSLLPSFGSQTAAQIPYNFSASLGQQQSATQQQGNNPSAMTIGTQSTLNKSAIPFKPATQRTASAVPAVSKTFMYITYFYFCTRTYYYLKHCLWKHCVDEDAIKYKINF